MGRSTTTTQRSRDASTQLSERLATEANRSYRRQFHHGYQHQHQPWPWPRPQRLPFAHRHGHQHQRRRQRRRQHRLQLEDPHSLRHQPQHKDLSHRLRRAWR
eukprot:COSAG06_NODE_865_length_11872_cov_1867.177610_3_plen_102_part_00